MWNIEALRVSNKQILEELNNMTSMETIIEAKRQLLWIGKLARLLEYSLPRQFMVTWILHPRKGGQPQLTLYNTMMTKVIQTNIPAVDKYAQLEVRPPWLGQRQRSMGESSIKMVGKPSPSRYDPPKTTHLQSSYHQGQLLIPRPHKNMKHISNQPPIFPSP
jgi:hypothetical protein